MTKKIFDKIIDNGISYEEYSKLISEKISNSAEKKLTEAEKDLMDYTILNKHRSTRVEKTFKITDSLKDTMLNISEPQVWMVITESWCGDSAQNLPVIAKIAEVNPSITLKIVQRDENPEIMDNFLTNGTKSIPVIAAFSAEGEVKFKWGPRPEGAVEVIKAAKAEGLVKEKMYEKLHAWYAKDRGVGISSEFESLLK